ncbi:RIP metalloprotease RseP [Candidatus Gottesmanbacteria bacterium RBG_16_43_7]|uniref:Zinc metalloprotease n=1 Tax=Candidatus Gottesmanbacteria bacterium RBG_16_43_7 TaxID=1798373 RepID=A0A1F5ZC88_9BACT|nr:MAG: RIP metalloprotease RseP [Candidatus Gottesmanbacteria bacterium RBG_16_43_7]
MLMTALTFIVVLSILVLIHELGHFLTARAIGVEVEEFGLGLPPRIASRKIGRTLYSLNVLPIGGFVKLRGEDEAEDLKKPGSNLKAYFWARSKKERSLILTAGVFMNFLLAVVITTGFLIKGVRVPGGKVYIEHVVQGAPADIAGLRVGDRIVRVEKVKNNNTKTFEMKTSTELIDIVSQSKGQSISLIVQRSGRTFTADLIPRRDYPPDQGPTGVQITDLEFKKYPIYQAPLAAVQVNLERAAVMFKGIGRILFDLITLRSQSADVAGPIGIARITGQAARFGLASLLDFISILSLNLAVLNILPFPALDGGRLLFIFVEKIFGRRVRPAFEKQTHQIGMLILLFLVLLISINDIMRITRGG